MRLLIVGALVLVSSILARDAHSQDNAARTPAEREFFSWNSTLPPRTVDGYHTALSCEVANEIEQVIAQQAADSAGSHRFELGSEKSYFFARDVVEQLGIIEESHGGADSAEIRKLTNNAPALKATIDHCRDVGLVYEDGDAPAPSEGSGNAGPDRDRTQAAIDNKFVRWSANWMVDNYLQGSAHIDAMDCGSDGCVASGHFSFSRGGAVHTIDFTAQIPSARNNEYALGRLCYNDTTTGMRDCAN